MKTALTIAGSDSSGGAGIQADIKTMTANGVFAMSAITALTAQNTTGVTDIFESTPAFSGAAARRSVYRHLPRCRQDRHGILGRADRVIAEKLQEYGAKHIVVDPVMVATSGAKLLRDDAVQALTAKLLPLAEVLTPNIPEAEILSGMTITTPPTWRPPQSHQREIRLCRAVQGRPPDQRRRRPAVARRHRQMVPRQAHRQPQHPRHRLHPVQRHCVQSGKGL